MQKGAHIPDELVVDILKSLPAKSLVRFKCVCKSWLSFISQLRYDNEEFILSNDYCFRSIKFKASGEVKQVMLGLPLSNSRGLTVIGSCNGLLCVKNCEDVLCIWNPWTKRHKTVSSSSKTNVSTGYTCTIVEIYSRKTDSWFQMGKLPQQFTRSSPITTGLFVNGTLCWHVEYDDNKDNVLLQTILCFDLVDRKFSVIVLPDDHDKKPDFDLCVLGGQLCMINYDHDCHSDIWAWEGNNNKKGSSNWIKLMSVPSDSKYLGPESLAPKYLAPVFLTKNGEVVLRIIQDYYMLFSYRERRKRRRSLVSPASDVGDDHESSFCYKDESTSLCLCRNLSDMDITVRERVDELQQHSTTTTREYKREVKPVICEHLLSKFGPHCKSSTSHCNGLSS
ncbi:hypothetical protein EZV62_000162 [Acer yangbiense]|uniref:F-box domain-containing protein n=1 Tax=Acer yangbiense TaxID=1000413 RepID=A0A5C7IQB9_9ROSI|nr:hypothetical protein EZV62_000162 [Acer yangbiense]